MIENMSHIGLDDYKPVALEWYAIIHFWDFLWLITAIFIQIRLSNFREVMQKKNKNSKFLSIFLE